MKKYKVCISIFFLLTTYCSFGQVTRSYKIIYSADKHGNAMFGDINTLIKEIENGSPVRIGWSIFFNYPKTGKTVEMQHWTDASFITVLNGHVFAQVRGIFKQGPQISVNPSIHLVSSKANSWVGIIGTTGLLRQKYDMDSFKEMLKSSGRTEIEIKKIIRKQETIYVPTKWAIPKE